MGRNRFAILLGVLFAASGAFAQQNDVAVSFGGTFTPGAEGLPICEAVLTYPTTIVSRSVTSAFSIEGAYAHRLEHLNNLFAGGGIVLRF
jgi:hypothetical protein